LAKGGSNAEVAYLYVCPNCQLPTIVWANGERSFPNALPGASVENVPRELSILYNEARSSVAVGAYTGAVLICRKILLNLAVAQGAKEHLRFVEYVEFFADNGYVSPHGRIWVDYIRVRGNEANHEIELMQKQDALMLITFIEMLLRLIYEFPSKVPRDTDS